MNECYDASYPFPEVGIVFAAGGSGSRYGGSTSKLLLMLDGMPLFLHSIRTLAPLVPPENRVIAVPMAAMTEMQTLAARYLPRVTLNWVPGGMTRIASTRNAVAALPSGIGFIAVHDAARPRVTREIFSALISAARQCGGAVPGRVPRDTIKTVAPDGMLSGDLPRASLFAVETPQVFQAAPYRKALTAVPDDSPLTDDAGIFMAAGGSVAAVPDPAPNPKITYPGDLALLDGTA